jgi:hypothetical protein
MEPCHNQNIICVLEVNARIKDSRRFVHLRVEVTAIIKLQEKKKHNRKILFKDMFA